MKKKKLHIRFVVVCIVFAMLASMSCDAAAVITAEKQQTFDCVTLLNRMGISAVYHDTSFITRGDFVVLAVQAAGYGVLTQEMAFADVSGEQGKYVSTAVQLGIVKPSDDGRFYPDRIITAEEAVTICLRVLGYDHIIDGGYPLRYMAQAGQLGLLQGLSAGDYVTCTAAANMLFEMLDAEYVEEIVTGDPEDKRYTMSEDTYMNRYLGVYTGTGTITSVCGFSINSAREMTKDEIGIDGVSYKNRYYDNDKMYLGRTVTYYIADMGVEEDEVLYLCGQSELIEVDFRNVDTACGFDPSDPEVAKQSPYVSYWTDDGKKAKKALMNPNATVIINGEACIAVSNADFTADIGRISLIDGDGDGEYDVIFIDRYSYYYVEYVSDETMIVDKFGKETVDLSKAEPGKLKIYHGEQITDVSSIAPDTVFALACSYTQNGAIEYSKMIEIIIATASETGVLESCSGDGKFTVNGKEYDALPQVAEELRFRIGQQVKLCLGLNGVIVNYEERSASEAMEYAYLVAISQNQGFREDITMRMYTDNDEMINVKVSDDFKYTGMRNGAYVTKTALKKDKILETIRPKQLIKYTLNEVGELSLLELPYDHSEEADYVGFDTKHFSMDYKSENTYLYMNCISENYMASSVSVYFYVDTESMDEADFKVGNYWTYGYHLGNSKVKVYDTSETSMHAGVVVVEDAVKTPVQHLNFMTRRKPTVISGKSQVLNQDGEVVTQLSVFYNDGPQKLTAVSDDLAPLNDIYFGIPTTVTKFSDLKVGDVISCELDLHGKIDQYVVLNEYDEAHSAAYYRCYSVPYGQNHMADLQYGLGRVEKFVPGSYFKLQSAATRFFNFRRTGLYCYVINIRTGNAALTKSIPPLNETDYVWVQCNRDGVTTIVVYR